MRVFRFFESLLEPTALPPETPPPAGLAAFYWHHARQARGLVLALFAAGSAVALLDTLIPVFIGRVVTIISHNRPDALHHAVPQLLGMAAVLLLARPSALLLQNLITNQAIAAGLSNMVRWQSHWHVVRQSWTFFQNDFAGRIANRVMQTGPALRESVVSGTNAVWYILVYGSGAIDPDGPQRLAAGGAGAAVVCRLCGAAALFRAAPARPLAADVGDALDPGRPGRRQLHQHPDGQALRPAARRGRVCARRGRRPDRRIPRAAAPDHPVRRAARRAQRGDGGRHRRGRDLAVERRPDRRRHRRDGAAADLADRQHRRLGGAERDHDLREYRRRAGRHALDRGAAADAGPGRCGAAAHRSRPGAFRRGAVRLWHGARRAARDRPDHRARRAGRAGRAVGRRQIDPGQSAAALLRHRKRPAS